MSKIIRIEVVQHDPEEYCHGTESARIRVFNDSDQICYSVPFEFIRDAQAHAEALLAGLRLSGQPLAENPYREMGIDYVDERLSTWQREQGFEPA
jgi:hypothetical protein